MRKKQMIETNRRMGMSEPLAISGVYLARDERVIQVRSDEPLTVVSSAVVGGDLERTKHIVNMHVHKSYDCRAPKDDLQLVARELGIIEPFVGMMTAAKLDRAQVIVECDSQTTVIAIVTVGLSHPIAAGVTPAHRAEPGTINSILVVDAQMTRAARVNAIITATEAKTLALIEAGNRAPHGGFASGTGTDAIVIASTERGSTVEYAGPIAPIGALIGRAVRRAIQNALHAKKEGRIHCFSDKERRGLYRAIYDRRDVRSHFTSEPIADDVLARLLDAAHHAPSVGFMQPWNFIIIQNREVRRNIHDIFVSANQAAAELYDGERRSLYNRLKLAGILEAPINLCVTCDETTLRGHGLGRQTMPETALYSTVCAVQNLWLAARAEGVGVGWVSILDVDELRTTLRIPEEVVPVAYLCLGYVTEFGTEPDLEIKGWEQRAPLAGLIHFERYGATDEVRAGELLSSISTDRESKDKS